MFNTPPVVPTNHEEALLQRLGELTRDNDPVPAHVTAAARAALTARTQRDHGPVHIEPTHGE